MMDKIKSKKTAYFLIELIVNCLFFVIAAAICINLFVSGYIDSTKSNELSIGMTEASNAVEVLKACDGDVEKISEILGATSVGEDYVTVYYDENWQVIAEENTYKYMLSIEMDTSDEMMVHAYVGVQSRDSVFFELIDVKHFLGA